MDDTVAGETGGRTTQDVFSITPDPTLVADIDDLAIVDANEAAVGLLGYGYEALLNRTVPDLVPGDSEEVEQDLKTAIETGDHRVECRFESADGDRRRVDISVKRATLDGHQRILAFVRDVTDQRPAVGKRQQAELADQRRQMKAVFEAPGSFIGVIDPDGTLLRANQLAREFADVPPSEYLGERFWTGPWFDHDEEVQGAVKDAIDRARDGDVTEIEAVHYDPGGDPHDVSIIVSPVTDDDGSVETIVAQGIDVTERRDRERNLAEQQERMETILESVPVVLFAVDADGVFTESRGKGLENLGLDPGEAVGTSIYEMYEGTPEVLDDFERALDGETVESSVQLGDLHHHTLYEPIFDENGEVEQVIGVSRDVSDLRERERELESWRDRLQTVLDNAPLALYSYDPDGTIRMSQGRGLELVGLEPGQLEGQNIYEIYENEAELLADYERAADGERFSTVRQLGATIFRTWYRPIRKDGSVEQVIAVSIDITDQKRQERRIEAVSEATSELITADSAADVADIVIALADEVLDMPLSVIWTTDDEASVLTPIAATESVLDRWDAESVENALSPIEPGTVEMVTFESGQTRVIEEYSAVDDKAHPSTDLGTLVMLPLGPYGQLHVGCVDESLPSKAELNIMEILARNAEAALGRAEREAELEAYRDELEQSNERLQQFAYIASHDLQEPLRMVSSYVDLLAMEYGDQLDEEADEYIEFAVDGAERMQSMIEDLLQYSRVQSKGGEFTAVETAAVVEETRRNLELAIEEADASVTVEALPDVTADRDQLRQVFQNLVANAIEHGGDSPVVTVRGSEDDDHCRFEVEDDGPGIPKEQRERIFKIFQQGSRDSESGTGIGLAVCERIVSRHGGDIWIESEPGEGSTFCFTIDKETTEDDSMTTLDTSDSDGD